MAVKVAINGFGRIGRLVARAMLTQGRYRPRTGDDQRSRRRQGQCLPVQARLGARHMAGRRACRRLGHGDRRQAYPRDGRARSGQFATQGIGRRSGARMHRLLRRPRVVPEASGCRRQEGANLGAGQGCRSDRRVWRQPRQAHRRPHDRVERVVHDQLSRAGGQGAQRRVRHRARADDHGSRLHQRPEDPRSGP